MFSFWVAEVLGYDSTFGFARRFIEKHSYYEGGMCQCTVQLLPGQLYEANLPNVDIHSAERKYFVVKDGLHYEVVGHEVVRGLFGPRTQHEVGDYLELTIQGSAGIGEIHVDDQWHKYEVLSVLSCIDTGTNKIISKCVGIEVLDTSEPMWPRQPTITSKRTLCQTALKA